MKSSESSSMPQACLTVSVANYIETKDNVYQGFVDFLKKEPPKQTFKPSSFFRKD